MGGIPIRPEAHGVVLDYLPTQLPRGVNRAHEWFRIYQGQSRHAHIPERVGLSCGSTPALASNSSLHQRVPSTGEPGNSIRARLNTPSRRESIQGTTAPPPPYSVIDESPSLEFSQPLPPIYFVLHPSYLYLRHLALTLCFLIFSVLVVDIFIHITRR